MSSRAISAACRALLWVVAALMLAACGKEAPVPYQPQISVSAADGPKVLRVGIHPLHNPQRLMEVYGPVIDHINNAIPEYEIQLEASRNYEEFEKKLYGGEFAFAMPNPYQTLMASRRGYQVIAKMADDDDFRGIILVRRDSGIQSVQDLKGKAVAYPAPTALAATMMPQYYLQHHGLNVQTDIQNLYVGSQESAILNVVRGHTAAAATWPVPWKTFVAEQPEQAARLVVKWRTDPLPNNGWVARKDLPPALVQKFTQQLVGLSGSDAGRQMLSRLPVSAFVPADDQTYVPVQKFLQAFSTEVRPVEH